jgi:hypothetical protein
MNAGLVQVKSAEGHKEAPPMPEEIKKKSDEKKTV